MQALRYSWEVLPIVGTYENDKLSGVYFTQHVDDIEKIKYYQSAAQIVSRPPYSNLELLQWQIVASATTTWFNLLCKFTLRVREPTPQFGIAKVIPNCGSDITCAMRI